MRIRAVAAALAAMGGATGALGAQAPVDAGRIDAVFAAYAGHDAPGCAVGVYREGRVAFARGYGMADLERRVPITPSTLFDLGSTSKQFAAAAIALLVAEGRLAYADDVRRHVPELPDYGTPITIDHLLRHTSGLRDYIGVMVLGGRRIDDASDDQEALDAIVRQRALNFPPGARWSYSNSGYFLLSVIVKRVTGRTLAEFAKERIFDPLGMARTHFRDDHTALLEGRALAYAPGAGGRLVHDMSNWDQTGDGAVWSSVEELVRWDRNFDDPQVGGAALLRDLQEPGRLADGSPIDYARGLTVDRYRGLPRVHHGGSWGGFRAMYMRFPGERTAVALTCNVASANTTALAQRVADVVLDGRFPEPPAAAAPAGPAGAGAPAAPVAAARYAGLYFDATEAAVFRIAAGPEGLTAQLTGRPLALRPAGEGRFEAEGLPVAVTFAGAGPAPDTARVYVLGALRGTYVRVAAATPSPADLAAYAGEYYSPELDATWRIRLEGDSLRLTLRTAGRVTLVPAMADAFTGQGLIRFTRQGRRVTGFDLAINRVQGLRFERRR